MPLPKPRKGEDKADFIDRCAGNPTMNEEYPDNKQRLAICHHQWDEKDKAHAEAAAEAPDSDFSDFKEPSAFAIIANAGSIEIQAASGDEKVPTFKMLAYTGGLLFMNFWRYPVVVDLKGMAIPSQQRPVRMQHDPDQGIGHTTYIGVEGDARPTLRVKGVISRDTAAAREAVASSKRGFPWQASIGAQIKEGALELVDEGVTKQINGHSFKGPFYHAKKTVLGEISFVDLGADDKTSVTIAARQASGKETGMKIKRKVDGKEVEVEVTEGATEEQITQAVNAAAVSTATPPSPADPPALVRGVSSPEAPDIQANAQVGVSALRAATATELKRIEDIRKICGDKHPTILAKAVTEGWDVTKAELEVLRASRPSAPSIVSGESGFGDNPGLVLEAAAVMTARRSLVGEDGGSADISKLYPAQILEAAHRSFKGRLGLNELLFEAARLNGYSGRNWRDTRETLRYAFNPEICAAGFSTVAISGILSNIANKFLLAGFNMVEHVWGMIAARRNVKDFKTVTSYRLTGDEIYEKVQAGGEIKHADLGEESFTNKAETYGKMFTITRTDIINDDLGTLTDIPRKLGRGSALKINQVFWDAWLDEAGDTFWTAGHANLLSGEGMDINGLTAAEILFMALVDPEGNPIGHIPTILLVPPALNAVASQLMRSAEVREMNVVTTGTAQYPIANPHAGKFSVVMSRYLTSASDWWLLCNPADLAAIEICFLNGMEEPTIENADADFNRLGIQLRGYHDFGVNLQDYRSGIKVQAEEAGS